MRDLENDAAFEAIYNRHKGAIYSFCLRILNDADEAKDVVQEVFVRYFETPAKFDGEISVKVWLFKSARNRCLNIIRDKGRLSSFGSGGDEFPGGDPRDPDLRDASDIVHNLFERMPDDYKEVLILREWNELSYEEIARTLETTVSAVKSKLFKARKQAACIYKKLYGD